MKLQYQLSSGNWLNCDDPDYGDRTEEFLVRCEENNSISIEGILNARGTRWTDRILTRDEVLRFLAEGNELRNAPEDWYSNCRDGEFYEKKQIELKARVEAAKDFPEGKKLSCGHTVYYKGQIMSASMGTSCAGCYDRMSD